MDKLTDNQEKWLKALESGEYKQCRDQLRAEELDGDLVPRGYSYCCLGVAIAVLREDLVPHLGRQEHSCLSGAFSPVREMLGLHTGDGSIHGDCWVVDGEDGEPSRNAECLIEANDGAELTFAEIAARIRAAPHKVFNYD